VLDLIKMWPSDVVPSGVIIATANPDKACARCMSSTARSG